MFKNTIVFNDFCEDRIVQILRIQKNQGVPKQNECFLVWDVCIRCPPKCASYSDQIWMNFVLFLLAKVDRTENKIAQE